MSYKLSVYVPGTEIGQPVEIAGLGVLPNEIDVLLTEQHAQKFHQHQGVTLEEANFPEGVLVLALDVDEDETDEEVD